MGSTTQWWRRINTGRPRLCASAQSDCATEHKVPATPCPLPNAHPAVDLMEADLPPDQAGQGRARRAAQRPQALDGPGQTEKQRLTRDRRRFLTGAHNPPSHPRDGPPGSAYGRPEDKLRPGPRTQLRKPQRAIRRPAFRSRRLDPRTIASRFPRITGFFDLGVLGVLGGSNSLGRSTRATHPLCPMSGGVRRRPSATRSRARASSRSWPAAPGRGRKDAGGHVPS